MTETLNINKLFAYRAVADGKFARLVDKAIKDEMSGKGITQELANSVNHHAKKNSHLGVFEFADRVSRSSKGVLA